MPRRRTILFFVAFPGLLIVIVAALLIPNLSASLVHTGQIQIQPLSSSTHSNLEIKPMDLKLGAMSLEPKVRRDNGSRSGISSGRKPAMPSALLCRRRSC